MEKQKPQKQNEIHNKKELRTSAVLSLPFSPITNCNYFACLLH